MATDDGSPISLDKFLWVQAFATRLAQLGAPGDMNSHLELGADLFATSGDREPTEIAEFVWGQWPTQQGPAGIAGD